jgi:hypothetical protein
MYGDLYSAMIREPIIREFKKEKIKGLKFEALEDRFNQAWTANYINYAGGDRRLKF